MDKYIHKGHRQRMRHKFSEFGARFFETYELLEMLLYYTVPMKDTNPIAKKLLSRFGSLDGIFSATAAELTEVEGIGATSAAMIKSVSEFMELCASENPENSKGLKFDDYYVLGNYVTECFKEYDTSVQFLFSFDNGMKLIGVDKIYDLDFSSGAVQPGAFLNAAIRRNASVVVVAHNHPHGPLYPGEADMRTNDNLDVAFFNTGILFMEHYIICGSRFFGFMSNNNKFSASKSPELIKFEESRRSRNA